MRSKKVILQTELILVMALLIATSVFADINLNDRVTFDGSMRWRSEIDGKSFDRDSTLYDYNYLRTRLGIRVEADKNVTIYLQIQDSRNVGEDSGGLENDNNLGVHQAYIRLSDFLVENFSFQVGRFELVYGRQRLLGSVGWSNVGRTWDGARFSYAEEDYRIDMFSLKKVETVFSPDFYRDNDDDVSVYGLYGMFYEDQIQLFGVLDWDRLETGTDGSGRDNLRRFTTGTYLNFGIGEELTIEVDAAYQFGYSGQDDIEAYMMAGDVAYAFDQEMMPMIGAGIDVTSGDDDKDANKIKNFNNLYYTGHKFRGFMDYFIGSGKEGLIDMIGRFALTPVPDFRLSADFHYFQTMVDHLINPSLPAAGTNLSKEVGMEIDLTGRYRWRPNLVFQGGGSFFIPSDKWNRALEYKLDPDPSIWFYGMITAGF